MEILKTLTFGSKLLYTKMIMEAEYEDYAGGFNMALMDFTKEERGNLSDLKKKGLVETYRDPDTPGYSWVMFPDIETAQAIRDILKG